MIKFHLVKQFFIHSRLLRNFLGPQYMVILVYEVRVKLPFNSVAHLHAVIRAMIFFLILTLAFNDDKLLTLPVASG